MVTKREREREHLNSFSGKQVCVQKIFLLIYLFFWQVKWVRMLYRNFSEFTRDQEYLISIKNGVDFVEGSLIMHQNLNNWRSSFFSISDQSKINSLVTKNGIIYCLEVVKYYDDLEIDTVDEVFNYLIILLFLLY